MVCKEMAHFLLFRGRVPLFEVQVRVCCGRLACQGVSMNVQSAPPALRPVETSSSPAKGGASASREGLALDGKRQQPSARAAAPEETTSRTKNADSFLTTFRSYEASRYRRFPSGLKIAVVESGEGASAAVGKRLRVSYTGWLQNGEKFDSSWEKGKPFEFVLGQGQVIKGWEEGLMGMRPGEKRQLVVPAKLAYGDQRVGTIPPNSTLVFHVELHAVDDLAAPPASAARGGANAEKGQRISVVA